jgi:hypothetical protein
MITQETQQCFNFMRSQRSTFAHVAQQLNLSRSTLVNWNCKFHFEINNVRTIVENLQKKLNATYQHQLTAVATRPCMSQPVRLSNLSARFRVLRENHKTKIALFLHRFCITFRDRCSYKMQRRSRLVIFSHLWPRLPIGSPSCRAGAPREGGRASRAKSLTSEIR